MTRISVIYFSQNGATAQLAKAAIDGVKAIGCDVHFHEIQGHEIHEGRFINLKVISEIANSHAVIFASPTYMGNVAAQFKSFADATGDIWSQQIWAGKLAAGITCGTALNGDQSSSLHYLSLFASQHGMLWIGLDAPSGYSQKGLNRLGCQLGVVAQVVGNKIELSDLETAEYLGSRIASLAMRLNV